MNKAHEERENANKEFEKMLEKYDRWVSRSEIERGNFVSMYSVVYMYIRFDGQSPERGVSAAESDRGDGGGQRQA